MQKPHKPIPWYMIKLTSPPRSRGGFLQQKKTACAVPKKQNKKRSDPRSQFWYAAIGGHFWWFLVSNIFCDPHFLLSVFCLTVIHVQKQNSNQFSMENTVRFFVFIFGPKTKLVLCRTGGWKIDPLWSCSIFRIGQIIILNSHHGFSAAHRDRSERITAFLQRMVTQAYMGLLLLHLNFFQNFVGVVHWGNPPSPWYQVSGFRCSLDCTSLVYVYIIAQLFRFCNMRIVWNIKLFFVYMGEIVRDAELFLDSGIFLWYNINVVLVRKKS